MQSQRNPQTPIQTMRPQDGSEASAKSLPLHLLNGPHAKWAIDMTEATDIKNIQQFCTQRCLLGLQQGGELDDYCPNVKLHQRGGDSRQHLINTKVLVKLLKTQLDGNIDYNCTPFRRNASCAVLRTSPATRLLWRIRNRTRCRD